LTNATLANIRWRDVREVKGANILGVKDAPEGFIAWATQHGAVATKPESQ